MVRESGDGRLLEQVERIDDRSLDSGPMPLGIRSAGEVDLEIEFRTDDVRFQRGDLEARQSYPGPGEIVNNQQYLEQRRTGRGARGIEDFHQAFQRNVGVTECGEVDFPDVGQNICEGFRGVDAGAQHQRVSEHADEVVECRLAASGDLCADGDVLSSTQAGHQHCQRRVGDHEERRVIFSCELIDTRGQIRTQGEADLGAARRLYGRTQMIRRQLHHLR
ncbi:hypothetical protein MLGJGCBP_03546 [Rhodococcus sp. T7]|nr:hypothetical protein MLGJGCBP_03546 [Rhodococcus sp. T7]